MTIRTIAIATFCLIMVACDGTGASTTTEDASATTSEPTGTTGAEPTTTTQSAEPVTLNIIHNWAATDAKGPPLIEIFDAFQEANPHITIEEDVFSDAEVPVRVETAFVAEQEPDIVLNNYWPPTLRWMEQGVTIPVTDLVAEWGLEDDFDPAALRSFTQTDGQVVAFPLEGFNWPIWYNTGILDEAGVEIPRTIDELLAAIPAIRAAGYQPLAAPGAVGAGRNLFRLTMQTTMTDEDLVQVFGNGGYSDNENARRGVELFVQLRDAGLFADGSAGLDIPSANQLYLDGRAAMVFDGSWGYPVPEGDLAENTVLGGFPLPEGSPHEAPIYWQSFNAKGVWITRNGAEKMDAVRSFVQFLFQGENIAKFVEQGAVIPPLVSTPYDSSLVNPLFDQSLTELPESNEMALFPGVLTPPDADSGVLNATQLAYVDGTTVDEILALLDAAYGG